MLKNVQTEDMVNPQTIHAKIVLKHAVLVLVDQTKIVDHVLEKDS